MPTAAPGFATSKMAYSRTPRHIEYFSYHEWIDTPAKMIAAMIESRLDKTGMFEAVLSGSPDVRADYRLDSEVKSLLQEFNADASQINLSIKVSLVAPSSRSLLNSQTFSYLELTDGANPEAGVLAAHRAAEQFLVDLANFLADSIEPAGCSQKN
jgi:cholesterol transport system auxiliary component